MRPLLTSEGSFPRMATDLHDAIRSAVAFQIAHGLELLTDGEQRGDMLSMYEGLPGITADRGIPRFTGRVLPVDDPARFVKLQDLVFVRGAFPDRAFRVNLTAPTTFAFACGSSGAGPAYRGATDPALHDDLTEAIRPLAREVGRKGVHLQIDDPILSQGMRDFGPALRRLDAIAGEVPRDRVSVHVCGSLARGKALEALLRLENVSVLNLAFAGRLERSNVALLDPRPWADRDLSLGAGCAHLQVTKAEEVMAAESVGRLLKEIAGRMGWERVRYVLPDCGFRGTPPEFVGPILDGLRGGFERAYSVGPADPGEQARPPR